MAAYGGMFRKPGGTVLGDQTDRPGETEEEEEAEAAAEDEEETLNCTPLPIPRSASLVSMVMRRSPPAGSWPSATWRGGWRWGWGGA